ncbi:MAG: hypothetical protein LBM77_12500 [Spirochaetaceae bacterium]|jgi:hypothetical protein|nr:hypothetical protein [Spirochaetaceae bacterium]
MKIRFLQAVSIICLLFTISGSLFAQNNPDNIAVNIRFYDQKVYFLKDAPIQVMISITNNGPETYHFKLAADRAFSLDFDARSLSNRSIAMPVKLVQKRSASGQIYYRDVAIDTGETFSFTENIQDYVNLEEAGNYIIQAKIFPDLINSQTVQLSNRLALHLRPAKIYDEQGLPIPLDEATNAVLQRASIPPDEVIAWTLDARQKGQWEKFFLYLDLQAMYLRDASHARQWNVESEEGRQRILANYRSSLQTEIVDSDIVTIPMSYNIEKTTYNMTEGTVIVDEHFRVGNYVESKRYTYYLERRNTVWYIVDYLVVNLGTE